VLLNLDLEYLCKEHITTDLYEARKTQGWSLYSLSETIQLNSIAVGSSIELERPFELASTELKKAPQKNMDEAILRQAIQQELSQYFGQHQKYPASTRPIANQKDYISSPRNLERVEEQLATIIAQGDLSHRSMEKFSFDVSKLSPKDRTLALSRLAKAINSGQVR